MSIYATHKISNVISISKIFTIHYYEFNKDYKFSGEAHDFWEMVYVDKGEIVVTAGENDIRMKQGEIIFHPPGEYHNIQANGITAPNVFIISFECRSSAINGLIGKYITLPKAIRTHISKIIQEAKKTFTQPMVRSENVKLELIENPVFGGEQLIRINLEALLIEILRLENEIIYFSSRETMNDHINAEILAILEKNIYNNISISQICSEINYGKTYLCTLFKNMNGYSIIEYYNMLKIAEAKKLIREKNYNFTEISNMLMFNNPHYFSLVFKKVSGMSPREYSNSVKID
ncbi:MAG: helix-turn-helix domain-containing protein [Ruminococcaceae bacterium]|nr:helix-turn-helix domain-containing protein [Oscillospiraceae bacterium]